MDHRACRCATSSWDMLSAGMFNAANRRGAPERGFAPPGAEERYSPDLRLEPVHLDLALVVDVPGRRLDVKLGVTVRARASGVRSLALDGVDLRELRVELPAGGQSSYDGRALLLTWD